MATELLIAEVDYWVANRLFGPGTMADGARPAKRGHGRYAKALLSRFPIPRRSAAEKAELAEVALMRQMGRLDARLLLTWEGMQSTRDAHPDPYGVNGVRYAHHRHPNELLSFLEHCGHRSRSVDRLRDFVAKASGATFADSDSESDIVATTSV